MHKSEYRNVNFCSEKIDLSERVHIRKDKTNPRRLTYLFLLLAAKPASLPLLIAGTVLAMAGIAFHGWAAGHLARAGYVEREKILTVRGPYRHCRNPYYLAHLVMDLGFFCMAGLPFYYLVYFPIIFYVYHYRWILKEEIFLEEEFGDDYRRFASEVPRWGVRLSPAPTRGHVGAFSWATFVLNREHKRAWPHLAWIAVFWGFAYFGNPFAMIDPLLRATFYFGFTLWLLCRDVFGVRTTEVSAGWCLVAFAGAAAGAIFLVKAPVWEIYTEDRFGILSLSGMLLGLFVAVTSVPSLLRYFGTTPHELFPRAMTQWFLAFLALGLISQTLGFIWLALLCSFVWWSLAISGAVSLYRFPERRRFAIGLALGYPTAGLAMYFPALLL